MGTKKATRQQIGSPLGNMAPALRTNAYRDSSKIQPTSQPIIHISTCKLISAGGGSAFTRENSFPLLAEVHLQVEMAFRYLRKCIYKWK